MYSVDRWLGILGVILGVAGLLAGYAFYVLSKKEAGLWYAVHPLRIHILDTAVTVIKGLEIRHNGLVLSDQNITATTVFFGNRGNAPIRSEDILEPLTVSLPADSEVLDVRVVKASRAVCKFDVRALAESRHTVLIGFELVEPDDGVRLQLIHRGNPDAALSINGTFVGAKLKARNFSSLGRAEWFPKAKTTVLIAGFLVWFCFVMLSDVIQGSMEAFSLLQRDPLSFVTQDVLPFLGFCCAFVAFLLARKGWSKVSARLEKNNRESELALIAEPTQPATKA